MKLYDVNENNFDICSLFLFFLKVFFNFFLLLMICEFLMIFRIKININLL